MGDSLFKRFHPVIKPQFDLMCQLISSSIPRSQTRETGKAATVTVEVMLCVTLRIFTGASYLDVGWTYGIETMKTYNIFNQTLLALNERLDQTLLKSDQECQQEAERLFQGENQQYIYGCCCC